MNKERRKKIAALQEQVQSVLSDLQELQGEEQEAFNNLPEGLQQADRGQAMEAAADALGEACSSLQEVSEQLDTAME